MDWKCLQREQIVLYPEERDGKHCIRIDYAGNRKIAEPLTGDGNMPTDSTGSAHVDMERLSLPESYGCYSPHAYIDYNCVYVWLLEYNDIKTTVIYFHTPNTHKAKIPNPLDSLDDS